MTFRDKRGLTGRLRISLNGLVAVGAGAMLFLSTSAASADELKILDTTGLTRSAVVLQEGGSAKVTIALTKQGAEASHGTSVSLINRADGELLETVPTEKGGIAVFSNVPDGTFNVKVNDTSIIVSDVKIDTNQAMQTSADSSIQKRKDARAMYVAGAGAVAGGIGIAIGAGSSGSGSSGSTASLSGEGVGASGVGGSGPGGTGAGSFDSPGTGATTAAIDDTPPDPGAPNTGGGTPTDLGSPGNNVGDPSQGGTGGTGGGGDSTPDPGTIQDPPTISGS